MANSLGVLHVILPEKKLLCTTRYTLIRGELVFNSDHPALFQQAQHVVSIKWADPQPFSQDRIMNGRIALQVITSQGILESEKTQSQASSRPRITAEGPDDYDSTKIIGLSVI